MSYLISIIISYIYNGDFLKLNPKEQTEIASGTKKILTYWVEFEKKKLPNNNK